MEGELRWAALVFAVKVGGKDVDNVLSFRFVEVGDEAVLFEEVVVVLCVCDEGGVLNFFDGEEVYGV